jgi:hypothetical protein
MGEARALFIVFGTLYKERQENRHYECDNGKGDEGHGANATNLARKITCCLDLSWRVIP